MKPFALVSLLFAFAVFSAEISAFTLTTTSTTVTTTNNVLSATPSESTSSRIALMSYGAIDAYYYRSRNTYMLYPYYASTTQGNIYAEGKPYVRLYVYIQSEGNYLINFSASGGTARLRHQSGGPVFDLRGVNCTGSCDYQLPVRLSAGYHYFYFWSNDSYKYVYSASVTPA
jgi:hypothetical protein